MTVSLADGGMGLGTMWGEQTARAMLGEAGFTSIETTHLDGDIVNAYIIATNCTCSARRYGGDRRPPARGRRQAGVVTRVLPRRESHVASATLDQSAEQRRAGHGWCPVHRAKEDGHDGRRKAGTRQHDRWEQPGLYAAEMRASFRSPR